ncbi:unnamed protein product, partial [Allacma fusca]
MKLKKFEIEVLGNSAISYFPGQTVSGILHIHNNKDYKHEGIKVNLEGKALVHWSELERVRKQGGKSSRKTLKTVVSSAEEKYFDV